jgi:nicotinate phosphoribosyltransferase
MKIALSPAGALFTDLYQLTMAYGYWKAGKAEEHAVFHLFFREHPFHGGFTIVSGLEDCARYVHGFAFENPDLAYLATLKGGDGKALFESAFLEYLRGLRLHIDIDGMPEGTAVFPQEPLLRVQGPILQAQLIESALLNFINFQSLIATKAARVCLAAKGDPVIEFGLRRAQGVDGAFTATRATYIGGCAGTSNVLAGKQLAIPVLGTHAHSWVMAFETELVSFEAYAQALPNNCVFLVDTYDSLAGVRHAIEIGHQLKTKGHRLAGIRLDSGDLAYLSIQSRKLLDEAGFRDAVIVASNDLDEHLITSLKQQGAAINVWGVGTKLVTAYDHPALGGVYKISGLRLPDGRWLPKLKLSEQASKVTNPGVLQVRRFVQGTEFVGDAIYDTTRPLPAEVVIVDPADLTRRKHLPADATTEELLVPVLRQGEAVYEFPSLESIRQRVQQQLSMLHPGIKRFENPHRYPAGLELNLFELKTKLILEAKGEA